MPLLLNFSHIPVSNSACHTSLHCAPTSFTPPSRLSSGFLRWYLSRVGGKGEEEGGKWDILMETAVCSVQCALCTAQCAAIHIALWEAVSPCMKLHCNAIHIALCSVIRFLGLENCGRKKHSGTTMLWTVLKSTCDKVTQWHNGKVTQWHKWHKDKVQPLEVCFGLSCTLHCVSFNIHCKKTLWNAKVNRTDEVPLCPLLKQHYTAIFLHDA